MLTQPEMHWVRDTDQVVRPGSGTVDQYVTNFKALTAAAAVVSAPAPLPALPPPPPKYALQVTLNPSTIPKTTGDVSIVASY
uniref:Uncharacterized protein n=1 Tax=Romanomermis culicivorax TaxID=13658 RepID=A0A915KCR3_ROMCU